MKRWLLDTGAIVAYLDSADGQHSAVVECLSALAGECHITSAVVTEAMHLMQRDSRGPGLVLDFLISADAQIHECTQIEDLATTVALMEKYSDLPMDFADATLVQLAGKMIITEILTLDRRGFAVYRTPAGKKFRFLLDA